MTEPLPSLIVPTGASKFNTPAGNGFAQWFGDIKQGVDVLAVEVLNRAGAAAATVALAAAQESVDLTMLGAEVPVPATGYVVANHDAGYKLIHVVGATTTAFLQKDVTYILELIPSASFTLSAPLQMGTGANSASMADTLAPLGTQLTAGQPFAVRYTPSADGLRFLRLLNSTANVPTVNVYTFEREGGLQGTVEGVVARELTNSAEITSLQQEVLGAEVPVPVLGVEVVDHDANYKSIRPIGAPGGTAFLRKGVEYLLELIPSASFTLAAPLQMGLIASSAQMVDTLAPEGTQLTAGQPFAVRYTPSADGLQSLRLLNSTANVPTVNVYTFALAGGLVSDVQSVKTDSETGSADKYHLAQKINRQTTELRTLKSEVDSGLSALTQIQATEGITKTATVTGATSRLLRVGLHYGPSKYTPSDSEIFFDGGARKDLADVRFFDASGKMLKAELGELVNMELYEDNSLDKVVKITSNGMLVAYNNGITLSTDNGATFTLISGTTDVTPNISAVYFRKSMYPVYVDGSNNIFAYAGGILYKLLASDGYATKTPVLTFSWTPSGGDTIYPDIQNHAMDAGMDGTLFMSGYQPERRTVIYRSTDGGSTWAVCWTGDDVKHQHVHHIHADKYSNKVYFGIDDGGSTFHGAYILVTSDGGTTWVDITETGNPIRGNDYYPTYFGDGYRLGGGESYYNGGGTVYRSVDDKSFTIPVKGVGGVRSISDFGNDEIIVAGVQQALGTTENQIIVSHDQGKTWKTIYRKFQPSVSSSGIGFRDSHDAVLLQGDTEKCIVMTRDSAAAANLKSMRIYSGGDHYYREAFILLDEVPSGPVTITAKTGYMMGYPYKALTGGEHAGLVYHVPLDEGVGRLVSDSLGNVVPITGDGYAWDNSEEPVRYGDYGGDNLPAPFAPSAGLKLNQGTTINFGKIPTLDFSSGYTITLWINPDSLLMDEARYNARPEPMGILSAGNISLFHRYNRFGYSQRTNPAAYKMIQYGLNGYSWCDQYFFVAFTVDADGAIKVSVNGTSYTYTAESFSMASYVLTKLSSGDFVLGTTLIPSAGYLSDVKVYNRVIGATEILEIYRGA